MSTTIDSLDIQISTSLGQSELKIRNLAKALGELKNQGKITEATRGMKQLAKALDVLNPSLNGMNTAKLQQLCGALSSLGNITKLSGLNSALNTLKKIPAVVSGLDTAKLDEFERKMERLSAAIGPLADRIERVGNGFSKLPNYVGKAVTVTQKLEKETRDAAEATKKHSDELNNRSLNLMSGIHNLNALTSAVHFVGDAISAVIGQAMEWDGIQYRFGRAFGEDAEEVYQYAQKINEALGINIQQFMQYSSLYGSLLSGFGMAQDKVTTISVGLTELSYDIWAAYNDRFKSLEDASEAVRSAITGEIEPIRNAGIALTEASLQEYLEQVGMAHISIEKLSEAQKAEVRYAAMMNAAMNQGIVGTYASEMQTAEGAVRNLSQAFKTLTQAFGSLFIPILQIAIPYVTAFVELLTEAVHAIADFFGITLFDIDWSKGAGDLAMGADKAETSFEGAAAAAKKIKDYTMGFDELNIIQPPDESGGSGNSPGGTDWGSGLDLKTLWDESVFAKAKDEIDEIKKKIEDWLPIIGLIGAAFGAWKLEGILGDMDLLNGKLKGLGTTVSVAAITLAVGKLVWDFTGAYLETGNETELYKALGTTALGTALAAFFAGKSGAGIVLAVSGVVTLTKLGIELSDGSVEWTDSQVLITALTGAVETAIGGFLTWKVFGPAITKGLTAIGKAIGGWFIKGGIAKIFTGIGTWFSGGGATALFTKLGTTIASIPGWGWLAALIVGVIVAGAVYAIADYDFTPLGEKFGYAFGWVLKNLTPVGLAVNITKWLYNACVEAFNYLKGYDWSKLWSDVWKVIVRAADIPYWWGEFKKLGANIASGIWNGIKEKWQNFWSNIGEFYTGFWNGFCKAFGISSHAKKMVPLGRYIVEGIWKGVTDNYNWIINKIKKWCDDLIKEFKSFFAGSGGKSGKPGTIALGVSLKKTGWSSVKSWIGSIPAVSQGVKLAKSGWSSVKSWVGTIPTLSAGIKLVKNGWSSVKNWLGNLNFDLGFKLPKIGVNWGTKEVLGFKISYPSGFYTYAKGGFPDMGQMFIANEAGPELVGKIGSRNAVVNNDQIVSAVSEGVYAAVVAAMKSTSGQGNGQSVNVYLDGKQITATVEQRQRERGATLMGNQVFSY